MPNFVWVFNVAVERFTLACWACGSLTWFDIDEEVPDFQECWRCGEIINAEL